MKFLRKFDSVNDAVDKTVTTPFVGFVKGTKKIRFASKETYGDTVKLITDGNDYFKPFIEEVIEETTKFIGDHGGMLATFNFDGTNNVIGGSALYNKLLAVYLDGVFYDIDDLVVNVSASGSGSGSASGSASGSGSGSSMSGIAFPNTITGEHEVEYVLELDGDGTIDISGKGWFNNCLGMTSFTIPNFIDGIDNNTFRGNTNIDTIILNSNAPSVLDFSPDWTKCYFTKCIIGSSVTSIGQGAFSGCTGLTSINIPDSVTSIDYHAFQNVAKVIYNGSATGSPWGAKSVVTSE